MALQGTIVNVLLIIIGSIIGMFLPKIPDTMKETIMKGIGLCVMMLGLQMALQSNHFLVVIISIVIGAAVGETLQLEENLNRLGSWLEKKAGNKNGSPVADAFVTATLVFVVGAMAVVGALDSGLRGDHQVLYTKALLDGFTSIILSSTMGFGVIYSAVPVFLYQGFITFFSTQINLLFSDSLLDIVISELSAAGGIMIMAIGFNMAGITKIKTANLLPGLLVPLVLIPLINIL